MLHSQTLTRPLPLTMRLDASALELSHEYCSDPSAVSCLRDRHMGIDLGFDFGKKGPALEIHALKSSYSSVKISPTLLSAGSSWVS